MAAEGGMRPSCSRRGRVSRTALPMAERQTSPRASARTSRVHSLRRCKTVSRTRSLLLIFWGKTPPRAPDWRGAPPRRGGGRPAGGAWRGGRGGQGVDDRGPGGAEVLVEEGEQVVGGGEPHRCDAGVVAMVFENFAGLVHEAADTGVGDLQQVGQHGHGADLPLVDEGEQQARGGVEQWPAT